MEYWGFSHALSTAQPLCDPGFGAPSWDCSWLSRGVPTFGAGWDRGGVPAHGAGGV